MTETGLYDPEAETERTRHDLPHWFQPGVVTFVTFRAADSMPAAVRKAWADELGGWLRARGIDPPADGRLPAPEVLPTTVRADYLKHRNRRWEALLDAGHGECVLRRRDLAEVVMGALRHFDGERYDLDCAVVMPNHVHLLARFRDGTTCRKQCTSWLHYTARVLNERLGRRGPFWQGEPFDHLVRSAEQFEHLRRYIDDNGPRAGLPPTDYLLWRDG